MLPPEEAKLGIPFIMVGGVEDEIEGEEVVGESEEDVGEEVEESEDDAEEGVEDVADSAVSTCESSPVLVVEEDGTTPDKTSCISLVFLNSSCDW